MLSDEVKKLEQELRTHETVNENFMVVVSSFISHYLKGEEYIPKDRKAAVKELEAALAYSNKVLT